VRYHVDATFPGPGRFKGAVTVSLKDGGVLTEIEEYNRGSAENPMSDAELRAKFDENAEGLLDRAARDRVAEAVMTLDTLADARTLLDLAAARSF
jgi:2-methylcitrate dehydratase PrpD